MITDILDYKLDIAEQCGIDFLVNTKLKDINISVENNFGPSKADLILECVGVQATINQAVNVARKGTTIVVVGVFGEKPIVDLGLVQDRELQLIGTLMYQKSDFEKAVEMVASRKINLEHLITHRFPFDQYLDAYHAIEESGGKYMKVMIELN
jgi:L-iditol 2-dehydrogenase